MMHAPDENNGAAQGEGDGSSYRRPSPHKEYDVTEPKPKAFMVEDAQWERLQGRVKALENEPSISWLSNAAWTAISICISAVLAVIVLPNSKGTHLGSGIRPALWAIAVATFALALILASIYAWIKRSKRSNANDICNEMDTIHEAWVERKGESGDAVS